MTTHRCPIRSNPTTPCCGRSPFELPAFDRMTTNPRLVDCGSVDVDGMTREAMRAAELAADKHGLTYTVALDVLMAGYRMGYTHAGTVIQQSLRDQGEG